MKYIKKIIPYIIIVLVVLTIRAFLVTPVYVSGTSMSPTLNDGEILILNKLNKNYKRFDIVVIDYKNDNFNERLIKRVIGLPKDKIRYANGKLYVNNEVVEDKFSYFTDDFNMSLFDTLEIPEDKYLVLGDNRVESLDSRRLGLIDKKDIKGTVSLRIFPLNKIGIVKEEGK